jgi:hypothetical protein
MCLSALIDFLSSSLAHVGDPGFGATPLPSVFQSLTDVGIFSNALAGVTAVRNWLRVCIVNESHDELVMVSLPIASVCPHWRSVIGAKGFLGPKDVDFRPGVTV